MNIDQQRAAFESWYMSKHKKLPTCPAEWAFLKSENGRYVNQLIQTWFEIYQAALASPEVQALRDALEAIVSHHDDYFKDSATESNMPWIWLARAALQSQPMPPEISRDLLGGIVDQVFGGAIEDTTVIEDIYRVIAREFAMQSQDREDAEVTAYALPGGISVERSMQRDGTYLWAVRDTFKHCLSRSGQWDFEPFPSSRTDEWITQHRFSSAAFAIDHARRIEGGGE